MKFSQYKRLDWANESIQKHFQAVADVYDGIKNARSSKIDHNALDSVLGYDEEIGFMTSLMNRLSYSDSFSCDVKSAAIASAEVILGDFSITKARRHWDAVRLNKGKLYEVARVAQGHMARAISTVDFYGEYDRVTSLKIISQKPRFDMIGDKRILRGSMASSSNPPRNNSRPIKAPTQFETLKLNMHPESAVTEPVEWLGVQWHENFHAMEAIKQRHNEETMGRKRFNSDNDNQLLVCKGLVRMDADFRDVAYDTYRASPSERLARMGQEAFVQRLLAEEFVMA